MDVVQQSSSGLQNIHVPNPDTPLWDISAPEGDTADAMFPETPALGNNMADAPFRVVEEAGCHMANATLPENPAQGQNMADTSLLAIPAPQDDLAEVESQETPVLDDAMDMEEQAGQGMRQWPLPSLMHTPVPEHQVQGSAVSEITSLAWQGDYQNASFETFNFRDAMLSSGNASSSSNVYNAMVFSGHDVSSSSSGGRNAYVDNVDQVMASEVPLGEAVRSCEDCEMAQPTVELLPPEIEPPQLRPPTAPARVTLNNGVLRFKIPKKVTAQNVLLGSSQLSGKPALRPMSHTAGDDSHVLGQAGAVYNASQSVPGLPQLVGELAEPQQACFGAAMPGASNGAQGGGDCEMTQPGVQLQAEVQQSQPDLTSAPTRIPAAGLQLAKNRGKSKKQVVFVDAPPDVPDDSGMEDNPPGVEQREGEASLEGQIVATLTPPRPMFVGFFEPDAESEPEGMWEAAVTRPENRKATVKARRAVPLRQAETRPAHSLLSVLEPMLGHRDYDMSSSADLSALAVVPGKGDYDMSQQTEAQSEAAHPQLVPKPTHTLERASARLLANKATPRYEDCEMSQPEVQQVQQPPAAERVSVKLGKLKIKFNVPAPQKTVATDSQSDIPVKFGGQVPPAPPQQQAMPHPPGTSPEDTRGELVRTGKALYVGWSAPEAAATSELEEVLWAGGTRPGNRKAVLKGQRIRNPLQIGKWPVHPQLLEPQHASCNMQATVMGSGDVLGIGAGMMLVDEAEKVGPMHKASQFVCGSLQRESKAAQPESGVMLEVDRVDEMQEEVRVCPMNHKNYADC